MKHPSRRTPHPSRVLLDWLPADDPQAPALPPFTNELHTIRPERRCHVVGLKGGDCQMQSGIGPDRLCYYHRKVADGLVEPEEPRDYPVYPLPSNGYVLVAAGKQVA